MTNFSPKHRPPATAAWRRPAPMAARSASATSTAAATPAARSASATPGTAASASPAARSAPTRDSAFRPPAARRSPTPPAATTTSHSSVDEARRGFGMTRMIDPLWERILSRRALLVTLAGTPLVLAAARRTANAQSSPAASPAMSGSGGATAGIVAATNGFLATLSPDQREAGLFPWTDTAQKQRWSNLPAGGFQRAGLMWGDLSDRQQMALLPVMQATLSADGYDRVLGEWRADDALAAQQANNPN